MYGSLLSGVLPAIRSNFSLMLLSSAIRVRHPKFGRGVIEGLYVFEDGTKTIRVNFGGIHGSKALHPEYVSLKKPQGR